LYRVPQRVVISIQYDLVACLIFSHSTVQLMSNKPIHGLADVIEKWANRFGIRLDRDPEQIS
jgi:hypothetical protein